MVSEEKPEKISSRRYPKVKEQNKQSCANEPHVDWQGWKKLVVVIRGWEGEREPKLVTYSHPDLRYSHSCLVCLGGPLNVPHQNRKQHENQFLTLYNIPYDQQYLIAIRRMKGKFLKDTVPD